MDTHRLEDSFLNGPVVDKDGYPYFVAPLSDGIPRIESELLKEAIDGFIEISKLDCDLIVAPEAMGIPLATGLSLSTGIPFQILRKRSYGLPGEVRVRTKTGYSQSNMFINGIERGERVAIVDDVIDTGGTIFSIVDGLREAGAVVTEILVVYNRSIDVDALSERMGAPIRWLVAVGTENDRPVIRGIGRTLGF